MRILITGGAGFIGSNLIRFLLEKTDWHVGNMDGLTYAGHLETCADFSHNPRYTFYKNLTHQKLEARHVFHDFKPDGVFHLAAESHVDRSLQDPWPFVESNILGTYHLLQECFLYWKKSSLSFQEKFKFLHCSTDEVFGSLPDEGFFSEDSPYQPHSPYSASKASADHLVRAWHHSYGFPILLTHSSNNYGPFQLPEKLIPMVIHQALRGQPIPLYDKGQHIRDWIYVRDHVQLLHEVFLNGKVGSSYNIGASQTYRNKDVALKILDLLNKKRPDPSQKSYSHLIQFVVDRPGHDYRYALNNTKLQALVKNFKFTTFEKGLDTTVDWYLDHTDWIQSVTLKTSKHKFHKEPSL